MSMITLKARVKGMKLAAFFAPILIFLGCTTPDNHITLIEIPSGDVAGLATECGILALKKPIINPGDVFPIQHVYRDGVVQDEARVVNTDEYLALMEPVSSQLNNVRFLMYPLAEDETLYLGILDGDQDAEYLEAELLAGGAKGDFVLCSELIEYPEPSTDGYGGIGLFAYREGAMWLAGILSPFRAEIDGITGDAYPFIGMNKIMKFIPDLEDHFTRKRKPFRPDFEHGVERDGSGE
jgi:hypothetical protein